MQIRVVCPMHQMPVELEGSRILFPTDGDVAAKSPDGWMDLDMSNMYCPKSEEGDCITYWKWELRI